MKYDVTYACGHMETIQLYGSTAQRNESLAYEQEKLCPICYAKKKEEERLLQAQILAKEAAEKGLPKLVGTAKQVQWAMSLRQQFIDTISKKSLSERGKRALEILLKSKVDASEWINNRYDDPLKILVKYDTTNREGDSMNSDV